MEIYNLHDVVTVSQLRSTISSEIRKNAHLSNPKVSNPSKFHLLFYFFHLLVRSGSSSSISVQTVLFILEIMKLSEVL